MLEVAALVFAQPGVGDHGRHGLVPVAEVIAAGLPWMDDHNRAGVRALARDREPGVPVNQPLHHGCQPGLVDLDPGFDQPAQHRACDRGLGDPAGRDRLPRAPYIRAGEVAVVLAAEDNVRDHAVGPLPFEQQFDFAQRPLRRKQAVAQRREGGVPVELHRIEPVGGNAELPPIVVL